MFVNCSEQTFIGFLTFSPQERTRQTCQTSKPPESTRSQPTCDVIHYDSSGRISDVTRDEATKSLLPCCVPQLQPDLWGRKGKGMGGKIQEEKKETKKKKRNQKIKTNQKKTEGMKINKKKKAEMR